MDDMTTFGKRFREEFEKTGMTQTHFSMYLKMKPQRLNDLFGGRKNPGLKTINKIVEAFEDYGFPIDLYWLITGRRRP